MGRDASVLDSSHNWRETLKSRLITSTVFCGVARYALEDAVEPMLGRNRVTAREEHVCKFLGDAQAIIVRNNFEPEVLVDIARRPPHISDATARNLQYVLFLQPRGANDRHFSSLPSVGSYVGERSRYTGCTRNDRQQDDACNTLRKTRFRGLAAAFLLPGQSKVSRKTSQGTFQ